RIPFGLVHDLTRSFPRKRESRNLALGPRFRGDERDGGPVQHEGDMR
ncbi:MAG: hypothetical protein QOI12_2493, partial [Alphaproteobacteria bacterium]|nr:hypothetical protein [Alphaproteobacteria bacterium]